MFDDFTSVFEMITIEITVQEILYYASPF